MRERRTPPIGRGRLRVAQMCVAWALAAAACSVLAAPAHPGVQAGRSRASVMMPVLLGGAFVLSGGAGAEASMLRIKKEAASRRRARAQETLRPGTFSCFESAARGNALLLPKPMYPPGACDALGGPALGGPALRGPRALEGPHAELLLEQATCSCQDVHDLQRKLARAQDDHRALARRVLRLEGVLVDLVQTLQTSDDIALLERRTCSAVVYNEELTRSRPLRLLREDLKKLQEKYAL